MLPTVSLVVLLRKCQPDYLAQNKRFNKERFQLAKKVRSARCSPFVISKVLAARMIKLITARARKNKRTARMLANARKDHSIPLMLLFQVISEGSELFVCKQFLWLQKKTYTWLLAMWLKTLYIYSWRGFCEAGGMLENVV